MHYLISVEPIVLNFTQSSFSVPEGNGPAQPVLELTRALDCCTISVRVDIEDNTATGKYYNIFKYEICNVLHVYMYFMCICIYVKSMLILTNIDSIVVLNSRDRHNNMPLNFYMP